ncbi:MAG: protease SohB, partial [Pseudomonadota bacterium]
MDFLLEIAEFALQAIIIVVALLIIIGFIASLVSKNKDSSKLKVKNLNKVHKQYRGALEGAILDKKTLKRQKKQDKKNDKNEEKKNTLFVLSFDGDIKASATDQLREEISSVLLVAKPDDEVVLCLESPGGMVHGYGLAASQLQRIKDRNLKLTVCVDKVAASGGYMMACIADKIISAPFAIIGSIGVVASLPNFHRILKKNDVDYLEITAGEYKRTLTTLGEITEPGMNKFKSQIQDIHDLFKNHVKTQRPQLDLEKVATGEYWYGQQAKDLQLVDEIGTSDDYLLRHEESHRILRVTFKGKQSL